MPVNNGDVISTAEGIEIIFAFIAHLLTTKCSINLQNRTETKIYFEVHFVWKFYLILRIFYCL